MFVFSFFVFKHKTAYELLISDCSSDVCSSDLSKWRVEARRGSFDRYSTSLSPYSARRDGLIFGTALRQAGRCCKDLACIFAIAVDLSDEFVHRLELGLGTQKSDELPFELGRESCRARVCQYV